MSTSRRQRAKEVRYVERRMKMKQKRGEPLTWAQSLRELPRLYVLHKYGTPLPADRPFYPARCEALLSRCEAAELRGSYRAAATLAVLFLDAFIDHSEGVRAR
jgi:hypothetical protein